MEKKFRLTIKVDMIIDINEDINLDKVIKELGYEIYTLDSNVLIADIDNEIIDYEIIEKKFTPNNIQELKSNEIFVFGSNEAGVHGAGAARLAKEKFGAIFGKGSGIQGQSFAIPTKNKYIEQHSLNVINIYVNLFITYASKHPELTFYVTMIGCGLAGYTPEDIAPMFKDALEYDNIILPERFYNVLQANL